MTRKLSPDDGVYLAIITKNSYILGHGITRKDAATMISMWAGARRAVKDKTSNWKEAEHYLAYGTIYCEYPDLGGIWAVAVDEIVGLSIREIEPNPMDKIADNQSKMVDLMQGHLREGEEWKDDYEEGEEEGDFDYDE